MNNKDIMKKSQKVIDELIQREIIPKNGLFDVDLKMIDSYYEIYQEVYPPLANRKMMKSNIKFAKKLAGLILMNLNIDRMPKVTVEKSNLLNIKCGMIYLISNPAFPGYYKIGMTKDIDNRLSQYQTGDPHRAYKIEHYIFVEDARAEERKFLNEMKLDLAKGEWVKSERVKELFGVI